MKGIVFKMPKELKGDKEAERWFRKCARILHKHLNASKATTK